MAGASYLPGAGSFCLGAAASPYSDPLELQVVRLAKKIEAGAVFLVTQPVFDFNRFTTWWNEVIRHRLQERAAIIAGVQPFTSVEAARACANARPQTMIPDSVLQRLASAGDARSQRATGVEIAVETIQRLSKLDGLRGFEIRADADDELPLQVIENAGLRVD